MIPSASNIIPPPPAFGGLSKPDEVPLLLSLYSVMHWHRDQLATRNTEPSSDCFGLVSDNEKTACNSNSAIKRRFNRRKELLTELQDDGGDIHPVASVTDALFFKEPSKGELLLAQREREMEVQRQIDIIQLESNSLRAKNESQHSATNHSGDFSHMDADERKDAHVNADVHVRQEKPTSTDNEGDDILEYVRRMKHDLSGWLALVPPHNYNYFRKTKDSFHDSQHHTSTCASSKNVQNIHSELLRIKHALLVLRDRLPAVSDTTTEVAPTSLFMKNKKCEAMKPSKVVLLHAGEEEPVPYPKPLRPRPETPPAANNKDERTPSRCSNTSLSHFSPLSYQRSQSRKQQKIEDKMSSDVTELIFFPPTIDITTNASIANPGKQNATVSAGIEDIEDEVYEEDFENSYTPFASDDSIHESNSMT